MLERLFGAEESSGDPLALALLAEFAALLPGSILVWFGLNASRLLNLPEPQTPDRSAPPDPMEEFWSKMPKALDRDLVALTAELHYLRVQTTKGDTLILYPFGRAVEELRARGHQVHRSHWIADAHLLGVEREGDRYFCRTDTGLSLPLSRSYRRAIRDLCASRETLQAGKLPIRETRAGVQAETTKASEVDGLRS